jgi:carboxyl-terminal processing protease
MIISLCLCGSAHAGDWDFDSWKNRPHEQFTDGARNFDKVKSILLKEYLDDHLTEDDLYRAAVQGMLAGAGSSKYDKLISPTEMAELRMEMSGRLIGIGIEIDFDDKTGLTTVLAPLPGSVSERAGVAPGDRILKVDGKSFKGLQFRDVVQAIRGPAGQPVTLTLLRDDRVLTLTIKREAITWSPVKDTMLPDDVGLVYIHTFSEQTPSLLHSALARMKERHVRGLVLDLRGNQGGLLEKMIDCASLLLPRGSPVVTLIHRGAREETLKAHEGEVLGGVPLVVLIDDETASGAEILAAALKGAASARLVGMRTHGKWNVQRIDDLPNHYAVKFTTGQFRTPWGALLDGKGLDPDIEVDVADKEVEHAQHIAEMNARVAADGQLRAALGVLRLTHNH